jgi:hypothetical protein
MAAPPPPAETKGRSRRRLVTVTSLALVAAVVFAVASAPSQLGALSRTPVESKARERFSGSHEIIFSCSRAERKNSPFLSY